MQPIPMHQMSFWELVTNSPEWVSAFVAILFGSVTAAIIFWQVWVMRAQTRVMMFQANVMRRQGRESARLLHQQNLLIRWQHEHEWLQQRNRDRSAFLVLTRKLSLTVSCLKGDGRETDLSFWSQLREDAFELRDHLSTIDLATFSTPYDMWFVELKDYEEAIEEAIIEDSSLHRGSNVSGELPMPQTLKELARITDKHDSIKIASDIETAIRMEFFDFKQGWDSKFP